MAATLITGGRVIDPAENLDAVRDVLLHEGKVAAVGERLAAPPDAERVDARGKWVLPGFIDLHVHLREPGDEYKETVATGVASAVAGGFTTVVAMPNTRPTNDTVAVTELILERARQAQKARVVPAGAITVGLKGETLSEIGDLVAAGCRAITDDGRPVMNAGLMRRALEYAQLFDVPVMVHEEDLDLSKGGVMNEGPVATKLGLRGVPNAAEVAMVVRDIALLEEVGGHLHIAHLSCAGSVRAVREARARGLRVTAEAAPHHFTLTDEAVGCYHTHAKMAPPLRSEADREAVIAAMADGTIDAIATDHAPHSLVEKDVEFDVAANGIVGLETALPLTLALVKAGRLTVKRAIELLTSGPAETFGLPGGTLAVGAPADVTIVDPEASWKVEPEKFASKSCNSPFAGWTVQGRVEQTFVAGVRVFSRERA
ncbi:MAG: dihydroorotase [Deltaproteobacteria bacterium]|nr:dihydroorotase [Deltaproteobacteria bacterium]